MTNKATKILSIAFLTSSLTASMPAFGESVSQYSADKNETIVKNALNNAGSVDIVQKAEDGGFIANAFASQPYKDREVRAETIDDHDIRVRVAGVVAMLAAEDKAAAAAQAQASGVSIATPSPSPTAEPGLWTRFTSVFTPSATPVPTPTPTATPVPTPTATPDAVVQPEVPTITLPVSTDPTPPSTPVDVADQAEQAITATATPMPSPSPSPTSEGGAGGDEPGAGGDTGDSSSGENGNTGSGGAGRGKPGANGGSGGSSSDENGNTGDNGAGGDEPGANGGSGGSSSDENGNTGSGGAGGDEPGAGGGSGSNGTGGDDTGSDKAENNDGAGGTGGDDTGSDKTKDNDGTGDSAGKSGNTGSGGAGGDNLRTDGAGGSGAGNKSPTLPEDLKNLGLSEDTIAALLANKDQTRISGILSSDPNVQAIMAYISAKIKEARSDIVAGINIDDNATLVKSLNSLLNTQINSMFNSSVDTRMVNNLNERAGMHDGIKTHYTNLRTITSKPPLKSNQTEATANDLSDVTEMLNALNARKLTTSNKAKIREYEARLLNLANKKRVDAGSAMPDFKDTDELKNKTGASKSRAQDYTKRTTVLKTTRDETAVLLEKSAKAMHNRVARYQMLLDQFKAHSDKIVNTANGTNYGPNDSMDDILTANSAQAPIDVAAWLANFEVNK